MRAVWLGAAGLAVLAGVVAGPVLMGGDWAIDGAYNIEAAARFAQGQDVYAEGRYLYAPAALQLILPLTWIPLSLSLALLVLAKSAIVAAATWPFVGPRSAPIRILAATAAIAFLPVLHDMVLGNTNVYIAAAVFWVAVGEDRGRRGVPLGLVLATIPKPWLVPLLMWMLMARPKSLGVALAVATFVTVLSILLVGLGPYGAWAESLLQASRYSTAGFNIGLSAISGPLAALLGVMTLTAAGVIALRDREMGLGACAAAGILVSPYLGLYGGVPLLLAVGPLARRAPYATGLLCCMAVVGVVFAMPLVALIVVLLALAIATVDRERKPAPQ
jgi:hypothetical protein